MAERMRAAASDDATAATAKSTLALGRWGITWNALHWIIAGGAELLAVTLPAAVAAASGAFVLYQGIVEQVGFRMQALYGATEATSAMIGKTTGDVLGLGHAFQSAQNAANPIAYELLGEYVDAARSHMVDLAAAGLQVDRALGGLGAKIDVDLIQQGGQLNSLLSNMVSDLIEIGQVFGNLGHAILNFASDMPGLAEVAAADRGRGIPGRAVDLRASRSADHHVHGLRGDVPVGRGPGHGPGPTGAGHVRTRRRVLLRIAVYRDLLQRAQGHPDADRHADLQYRQRGLGVRPVRWSPSAPLAAAMRDFGADMTDAVEGLSHWVGRRHRRRGGGAGVPGLQDVGRQGRYRVVDRVGEQGRLGGQQPAGGRCHRGRAWPAH